MKRRVGYYTENANQTNNISVFESELSDEEYSELIEVSKVIFDVGPVVTSFDIVCRNFSEIESAFDSIKVNCDIDHLPNFINLDSFLNDKSMYFQKVSNFLASANAFLENAEHKLDKCFSKSSEQFVEWNEKRNKLHSEEFSYRLMYKMRNYSIHCDVPISKINFSKNLLDKGESTLEAKILTSDLLKASFNWGKLRKEIEGLDEEVDFNSYLYSYMKCLRRVFVNFFEPYKIGLADFYNYRNAFFEVFTIPKEAVPVVVVGEFSANAGFNNKHEILPIMEYRWILEKFSKAKFLL